jgi:hypothetical protein
MGQQPEMNGQTAGLSREAFRNPPAAYRGKPLWSWNDRLEKEEILRQFDALRQAGMGGVFMHPRPGIWTPFLGEEWFELAEACAEYAKAHGLELWIYDESSYPSGFAGGLVHDRRPDLAQRALVCHVLEEGAEAAEPSMGDFWLRLGADGAWALAEGPGDGVRRVHFSLYTHPNSSWLNDVPYPDLLNPELAKTFLEVAYEPYRERFGDLFGSVIPGAFSDEPNIRAAAPRGALRSLPWTEGLPELFRECYGYDLLPRLADLVFDLPDAARTRVHYWRLIAHRFVEAWVRPMTDWCEKHGLQFTGHVWEHEFSPAPTGSIMYPLTVPHIPGMDLLGRNVAGNRTKRYDDVPDQMGNVQMVKAVTSVAHQMGRQRVLSETYGAGGWDFSFEDQKQYAEWQAALGVNFLNQHLSHYSLRGFRKHDHPVSFLDHEPWWPEYPVVNDYLSRLYYALSQGQYRPDLLVLHPMSSLWIGYRPRDGAAATGTGVWAGVPYNGNKELEFHLDHMLKDLVGGQWAFDLGDEMVMAEHGAVEGAALRVGQMTYGTVVLPPMVNLARETVDLLTRFAETGGRLAAVAPGPYLVDGVAGDPALAALMAQVRVFASAANLMVWLESAVEQRVRVTVQEPGSNIFCHALSTEAGELIFLANMGETGHQDVRVQVASGFSRVVERWDLRTGEVAALPTVVGDGWVEVTLDFASTESHLLLVREGTVLAAPAGAVTGAKRGVAGPAPVRAGRHEPAAPGATVDLAPQWEFRRLGENALVIDRAAYRFGDGEWQAEAPVAAIRNICSRRYGLHELAFNDVQPWRKFAHRAPFVADEKVTLRLEMDLSFVPAAAELVVEEAERWAITVNGKPAAATGGHWLDRSFRRLSVDGLLRPGINRIELTGHFGEDVSMEPIYLIGDFAVTTGDFRRFRVVPESGRLAAGSWVHQGYPFYAGRAVCAQTVDVPAEPAAADGRRVWLALTDLPAPVARVRCNGAEAGVIAWQPYQVELTGLLQPGANRVEVELASSLRNLLGPHHTGGRPVIVGPWHFHHGNHWSDDFQLVPEGMARGARLIWEA